MAIKKKLSSSGPATGRSPGTHKKITIAVMYGGVSGEHEVSLQSAASVIAALDTTRYDIVRVKIEKNGLWNFADSAIQKGRKGEGEKAALHQQLKNSTTQKLNNFFPKCDVVFPIIHGTGGEDGCLQGLLELAGIPYVGSGVLGSAIGMDKITQKKILERDGFPVAPYAHFRTSEWKDDATAIIADVEARLGYPCFVKPANLGSSVGISKAHHRRELRTGIDEALRYDDKIVVEKAVLHAREIECGVLGNDRPSASVLGEIVPSNEFYDYAAKYVDGKSTVIIPADLPKPLAMTIREMALKAFRSLDTAGFARVDFFVERTTNEVYINEINTLPGFTSISMFPMLWQASGLTYPKLLDTLIELALARAKSRAALTHTFLPPTKRKRS